MHLWGSHLATWVAAIDAWTAWMRAAGCSPSTIELRRFQLGRLAEAFGRRSPWSLNTADLVGWTSGHDWQPQTRLSYRTTLRSFYGWAKTSGASRRNPTATLPSVRTTEPPPRPCPDDVLDRALATATDRNRLILLLAAYAGLRRAEIAGLRWADITAGTLRVHGKGGRVRVVPLHPKLDDALRAERSRRRGRTGSGYRYTAGGQVWLFPGQSGGHLSPNAVGCAASRLLGPGWTVHTLRHRFATRALRGTGNLAAVQVLLGHADPGTTIRYTKVADQALGDAVRSV
ncbi:MAG: site-specific integrase [Sporichthyaceae bacterium]|nr:site-specific integrase [Sporichthyaceae bacterium]